MVRSHHLIHRLWLVVLLILLGVTRLAQAEAFGEAWDIWDDSDESSTQVVDHSLWQQVLEGNIRDQDGLNLFDYAGISEADQSALAHYLDAVTAIDPRTLNKREQYAYWVNLYNALTVQLILDNYPVESIKDTKESFFSFGPWDDDITEVAGHTLTLNHIEHAILRPIWRDERIHYAVNCASIGCPNLGQTAYTSANLETLLEQAVRDYVNHPRGVRFDGKDLVLSKIFTWYADDFGSKADLLAHLAAYSEPEQAAKLKNFKGDIDYSYDWNLNGVP